MRVTVADTRGVRYCSRGVREFLQRRGFDYLKFVREGIPADELRAAAPHDPMITQLIENARKREG